MKNLRIVVLAVVCTVVFLASCTNRPLRPELTQDSVNAIALCSAGYQNNIGADLKAEYEKNIGLSGKLNAIEGGGDFLKIGDLKGQDAVNLYKEYVSCINKRTEYSWQNNVTKNYGDIPEPIDMVTATDCLRPSPRGFTNYCNFAIAVDWCFHIGGSDPDAWKSWINGDNRCEVTKNSSPPIKPKEIWPFPMDRIPQSPDGKWTAGLKFIRAVRFR